MDTTKEYRIHLYLFLWSVKNTPHPPPPTKNQATLPSLSTHPLVSSVQKNSLPGVGGVFLTKGERELEVAETVGREAMQQPAEANETAAQ
jgi:hypothetical protein